MIKNIFIFVGGRGTRLGKLTQRTPKPLLLFNRRPFLDYLLKGISALKAKKIYLLCFYKSEQFFKKYHLKKISNTQIICIKEAQALGTAGSLFNAKKYIENQTLVCNGDTFFDYDFEKFNKINLKKKPMHMFCISNHNYKSNKKLSNLSIQKEKIKFKRKSNIMNSGIYIINKNIRKFINKNNYSLEDEIIPNLINNDEIIAKKIKLYSLDIGIIKNYKKFLTISKKIKLSFRLI
jgi:NDP-sugar pyrophosphorylase family protein